MNVLFLLAFVWMRFLDIFVCDADHHRFVDFVYSLVANACYLTSASDDKHVVTFEEFDETLWRERTFKVWSF